MDDSATGRIEPEYIVIDLVREKCLELEKGTYVLGLNSLFYIRFVYLDVRHLPHVRVRDARIFDKFIFIFIFTNIRRI
jgi:hypothetical protein